MARTPCRHASGDTKPTLGDPSPRASPLIRSAHRLHNTGQGLHGSWRSPAGVRVNSISPGPIYTNAAERELFDSLGETTVLGRVGEPNEVADLIGFLASPRASYITGTNVPIDGGRR